MKLRRILIGVIAAATLIVAAGVVVSFLPTKSGHSVAQTVFGGASTSRAADPGESAAPIAAPSGPGTSQKSPVPESTLKPSKQDNTLLGGLESPPTATPTPYRLPAPTRPPASIQAADLAIAPNSKVSTKSVSTSGEATQVDIDATTTSTPSATLAFYQGVLTSLGMTGRPVPAVGGSTAIAFSRGASTVTLTIDAHDKGSHYLIHGVLRTGA